MHASWQDRQERPLIISAIGRRRALTLRRWMRAVTVDLCVLFSSLRDKPNASTHQKVILSQIDLKPGLGSRRSGVRDELTD
jgi:hypothetical protein